AEDGIRYFHVTGVQTCALPISAREELGADADVEMRAGRVDDEVARIEKGPADMVHLGKTSDIEDQLRERPREACGARERDEARSIRELASGLMVRLEAMHRDDDPEMIECFEACTKLGSNDRGLAAVIGFDEALRGDGIDVDEFAHAEGEGAAL